MWSTGLYPVTISVSDALLTTAELRQRTYQGIHDAFDQAVADGRASPFFLPLATLGPFLLPTIWLVIPHTHRPWLYNMRWFVAAAIVAVDLDLIRWARSPQSAIAYAVGVIAVWGILTTLNLLIWTRPQFDAARVIRRRKSLMVTGAGCDEKASIKNELRKMEDSKPMVQPGGTPGEDGGDEEYEYVWEPFPEDGPLLDRIYWAWGLLVSFRGVGWNWWSTSLPHPKIPKEIRVGTPVDVKSIPTVSRSGFTRANTECEFLRARLLRFAIAYLILDFIGIYSSMDPYFTLGRPTAHLALPTHLQSIPPWLIYTYRNIFTVTAIYCAMAACTAVNDLFQFYVFRHFSPIYGELWMYADINGPFSSVLDHGLAGFWGRLWHQSFRVPFAAPTTYFVRHGYLTRGTGLSTAMYMIIAFVQSGWLHVAGSYTTIPETRPWRPMAFFILQSVGILIQQSFIAATKNVVPKDCQLVSRVANALYALVWLNITGFLLADDLVAGGIWLMQSTIFSVFRMVGLGQPGEHLWRADFTGFATLHGDGKWWQRGVSI